MSNTEQTFVILTTEDNSCVCKPISTDEVPDVPNGVEKKSQPEDCVERHLLQPNSSVTSYIAQVKYLNISNCNLKTIDPSLSALTSLLKLNISGNELSTLPETLVAFKKLHSFDLSNNHFLSVPRCITKLNFIINLNLSHNPISSFDDPPNCVSFLKRLYMSHTKLESLPKWLFSDSRVIIELLDLSHNQCFLRPVKAEILYRFQHSSSFFSKSLKKLDLSNCGALPKNLDLISYFNNLQHLYIGNEQCGTSNKLLNCLWDLPPSLFLNNNLWSSLVSLDVSNSTVSTLTEEIYLLSSLKMIDASHNELNWLPNNFATLVNLEVCNLSHNLISMLPPDFSNLVNLKKLFVSHNQLDVFPTNFEKLVNLEYIDFYSNHLEEFPVETVKILCSQNLKGLDLAWNKLDLPDGASKLDYCHLQSSYRSAFNPKELRYDTRRPVEEEVTDCESDRSYSSDDASLPPPEIEYNCGDESEEEIWKDESFDDLFDPTKPNCCSRASSCPSLPPVYTPPVGYYCRDDIGPLFYAPDRMAFCPADNHPPSIREVKRPPPQNYLLNSEQFEDS